MSAPRAGAHHRESSSKSSGGIITRVAARDDATAVLALDPVAATNDKRRGRLLREIDSGRCLVAERNRAVVGYAVLGHDFFDQGFVHLLHVGPVHRRKGVAVALFSEMEKRCAAAKIFSSTNRSNVPMRSLMTRLGYRQVGFVDGLDEGDPEVFYMKHLGF
ncbi:MAG: GNAT family N-acetyltransferase [Hyphomicrobiales bacterium]|nr:GNAT family N-acetyltransferase [Hyphomicrobiales bacterium]